MSSFSSAVSTALHLSSPPSSFPRFSSAVARKRHGLSSKPTAVASIRICNDHAAVKELLRGEGRFIPINLTNFKREIEIIISCIHHGFPCARLFHALKWHHRMGRRWILEFWRMKLFWEDIYRDFAWTFGFLSLIYKSCIVCKRLGWGILRVVYKVVWDEYCSQQWWEFMFFN